VTQIDLSNRRESGLINAIDVLSDVEGIHFNYFKTADIVRHQLVQRIVEAFEKHNEKHNKEFDNK
jgi:phosphate starvation-inducible protein PhoH and related proteins